jgi:hypothetical protein
MKYDLTKSCEVCTLEEVVKDEKEKTDRDPDLEVSGHGNRWVVRTTSLVVPEISCYSTTPLRSNPPLECPNLKTPLKNSLPPPPPHTRSVTLSTTPPPPHPLGGGGGGGHSCYLGYTPHVQTMKELSGQTKEDFHTEKKCNEIM